MSIKGIAQKAKQLVKGYGKRVTPAKKSVAGLDKDDGMVIEKKGKKIAVYKDKDGLLHSVSAVCRHLGCIVDFNKEEKTWDCPCHGSRYSKFGNVINGPATKDLPEEAVE